jgi:1-acyl-sn-glycerol-3-phosphate acyltransferase
MDFGCHFFGALGVVRSGKALMARKYDQFSSPGLAAIRFVAQRGLLKAVVWSTTRVTVMGRERLADLDGAFVLVANHSSHLDAPLIMGALPRRLARYLASGAAADYFYDVKWRKHATALFFNTFPVDRTGSRTRPGMSRSLLERGVPLLIFPEGSRTKTGEMGRFKPGAAALAIACSVPAVPIAVIDADKAMPRGRFWPVAGRNRVGVVFGSPMTALEGETPDEFSTRLAGEVSRLRATRDAVTRSTLAQKGNR